MTPSKRIGFVLLLALAVFGYMYINLQYMKRATAPFTLVVLPDTQEYVRKYHGIFKEQVQWILDNRSLLNIRFVSHMGDIVSSHMDVKAEWEEASAALKPLEGIIPYGIIPGNHDVDRLYREDGVSTYDTYFPASRYNKYSWYKGNRKENQNNYQIITTRTTEGPLDLLFLNLEIEPSNNTLAWADNIAKTHTNAYIILTTHKYLDDTGMLDNKREYSREGNTGQQIWDKLVKQNCSIKMVLNGHFHKKDGEAKIVTKNRCGDNVYQIIQDYQERETGGNGRLRYYTFDPIKKTISAKTYSPHTKTFEDDANSTFEIPFVY